MFCLLIGRQRADKPDPGACCVKAAMLAAGAARDNNADVQNISDKLS
jgi:hypothetical protein